MQRFGMTMGVLAFTCSLAGAQTDLVSGQVVKVDSSAANITIKHEPIPKLGMKEGMTMVFHAKDAAILATVKVGDRVRFDAEHVNGQFIVTKIEKAK